MQTVVTTLAGCRVSADVTSLPNIYCVLKQRRYLGFAYCSYTSRGMPLVAARRFELFLHFTEQIISVNGLVHVKSMCAAFDVTCKLRGTPGPRVSQFGTPLRNPIIDFGSVFALTKKIVKTMCMQRRQTCSAANASARH
jgi:hypothetical protein